MWVGRSWLWVAVQCSLWCCVVVAAEGRQTAGKSALVRGGAPKHRGAESGHTAQAAPKDEHPGLFGVRLAVSGKEKAGDAKNVGTLGPHADWVDIAKTPFNKILSPPSKSDEGKMRFLQGRSDDKDQGTRNKEKPKFTQVRFGKEGGFELRGTHGLAASCNHDGKAKANPDDKSGHIVDFSCKLVDSARFKSTAEYFGSSPFWYGGYTPYNGLGYLPMGAGPHHTYNNWGFNAGGFWGCSMVHNGMCMGNRIGPFGYNAMPRPSYAPPISSVYGTGPYMSPMLGGMSHMGYGGMSGYRGVGGVPFGGYGAYGRGGALAWRL